MKTKGSEAKKARVVFVVDVGNMKSCDVIGVCLLSQSAPENRKTREFLIEMCQLCLKLV